MTTYDYSEECTPPCPLIPIKISNALEPDKYLEKTALLDTGSEISCIPKKIAQELDLQSTTSKDLAGVSGSVEETPIYTLNIEFNDKSFIEYELFEFADEDYLLIGRDILNEFHICFDGINLNVNIHDDT